MFRVYYEWQSVKKNNRHKSYAIDVSAYKFVDIHIHTIARKHMQSLVMCLLRNVIAIEKYVEGGI